MTKVWTLAEIRKKVRRLTGRPNVSQIADEDIDGYIDNYYRQILPLQTGSPAFDKFSGGTGFTGTTIEEQGEYDIDITTLLGIKKPFLLDGNVIPLSFDLKEFMELFPPANDESPTKPTHALLWERKIYLRPLPDDNDGANYDFEAPIVDIPSSLDTDEAQPVDPLFGPMLAYGSAIDLLMDYSQTERASELVSPLSDYSKVIFRKDIIAFTGRSSYPSF